VWRRARKCQNPDRRNEAGGRPSSRVGEGPAKTQDDVRTLSSGRRMNVERRCGGRGTGAIRATGSYEGSLTVEGISGRHEPSPFTRGWSRRPRRLPHAGKRSRCALAKQSLQGDAKALRHSAEEGEATEMSEARSVAGAVGRKRPRSNPAASERRRSGDEARRQRVSSYDPLKRSRVP